MIANPGDPLDYLEVVGAGRPMPHPSAGFIAIPTTAGTGSEVTRNAVLASPADRVKASLRSAGMLPRLAVIDPELTYGLPPRRHRFHRPGRAHAVDRALRFGARQPHDRPVLRGRHPPGRRRAAARLGRRRRSRGARRHVLGQPAGRPRRWPTPDWARCTVSPRRWAACFPLRTARCARPCCLTPWRSTSGRCGNARPTARPCGATRRWPGCSPAARTRPPRTASNGSRNSAASCEIPPLRTYGVSEADIPGLVDKAAKASSMKGNPIVLEPEELREIVALAM